MNIWWSITEIKKVINWKMKGKKRGWYIQTFNKYWK